MKPPRAQPQPVGRPVKLPPQPIEPVLRISTGISGLAVESPIAIEINGIPTATLLCTPESLDELVVGWCFGQGFIDSAEDISRIKVRYGRAVVMLKRALPGGHDWKALLTSGFDASLVRNPGEPNVTPPPRDEFVLEARVVLALIAEIFQRFTRDPQDLNLNHVGATDGQTVMVSVHDISRHNALDKLIGWSILAYHDLAPFVVATTGRISAAMVHRAMRAGVRILACDALPSAQAVRLAQGAGMTLIGNAMSEQRTIFTHPWRIDRSVT